MEDYKAILANTRKLYEVMCKSTPDFGKKKNYVLMTVNAKFGEWNGDMSVGVVMTDGDLEAPIVYCSFFNPKCDGAFMTVIIQFNNMIQILSSKTSGTVSVVFEYFSPCGSSRT